jgi:hypothetical protein
MLQVGSFFEFIKHHTIPETHGIRVVSKYSRSKAFDSQADQQIEERKLNFASKKKDFNNNKVCILISEKSPIFSLTRSCKDPPLQSSTLHLHFQLNLAMHYRVLCLLPQRVRHL